MKLPIAIVFGFLGATYAVSFNDLALDEWSMFKAEHNKIYATEEEDASRFKIYLENRHTVAKHNTKFYANQVSFKMGLNKYADMHHSEFVQTMNGFKPSFASNTSITRNPPSVRGTFNKQKSTFLDWREKGAVTPVKDQERCGSCWSFSATGALEGQHFLKTGILVSLSEQNLIDCSRSYGNNGCHGGYVHKAFIYIRDNGGIDTEESYPYFGEDADCMFDADYVGATDNGFVNVASTEEDLKDAVAEQGPISVAIDSSNVTFHFYSEGIYFEPLCSQENVDHAVLVVGYGTDENGQDYWIVKNSWGTSWGDRGYIKMIRNKENNCGIATWPKYPNVE